MAGIGSKATGVFEFMGWNGMPIRQVTYNDIAYIHTF